MANAIASIARHGPRTPMRAGALIAALGYGSLPFIDASTPLPLPLLLVPFLPIPTRTPDTHCRPTPARRRTTESRLARIGSAGLRTGRVPARLSRRRAALAYPAAWIASSYTPATRRAITALSKWSRA